MIRYSKAFIFWGSLMLSLSALSVGYGFWTDRLDLEGEADIKLSINVIDDVVYAENLSEAAIQIIPETVLPDSGDNGGVEFIDAPPVVEENPDTTLPDAEPPAESTVEPPAESTVEPPAESTVEPPTESTVEPPTESTVEPPAEPPAESTVEPPAESTVEPPAEPPAESTVEPPAESTVEPPAESTVEPPAEPTVESPAEPATDTPTSPETDQSGGSGSSTGEDIVTTD